MTIIAAKRPGCSVDTSGVEWQLQSYKLDFTEVAKDVADPDARRVYVEAVAAYMRHKIPRWEEATLYREFMPLARALSSAPVREAMDDPDGGFLIEAFKFFKTTMSPDSAKGCVAMCRRWYVFCSERCFEGFDSDAASIMEGFRIGSTMRGVAVKRRDPDEGPLTETEARSLGEALWQAIRAERLAPDEAAACLLFFVLGANPENLCRLNECDLESDADEKGRRLLWVPRIKKGDADPRAQFQPRLLLPDTAAVIDRLIAHSAKNDPPGHKSDATNRPLFACDGRRVRKPWFGKVVSALPKRLALVNDGGDPLCLWPRRLRYTFARRAVLAGVKAEDLMILLDHSSLATCLIYYDPRLMLTDTLDAKLGPRLATLADIALGRQRPPPPLALPEEVPSLASAPLACLTCRHFVAVAEAPISFMHRQLGTYAAAMKRAADLRKALGSQLMKRSEDASTAADNASKALAAIAALGRSV